MGDRYRFRLGHVTDLTAPTIPLIDMGRKYTYHGLAGGLYPGGYLNNHPPAHLAAGLAAAALVEPLDTAGTPDPTNGKIVLVTSGMSDQRWTWCVEGNDAAACVTNSVIDRYTNDVNKNPKLVLINGAVGGWLIDWWDATTKAWTIAPDGSGTSVDTKLAAAGVTREQVQVIVGLHCHRRSDRPGLLPLPDVAAHCWEERDGLINIIAAARTLYPNLRQVFMESRIYGGWLDPSSNVVPEPFSFENGYAVRAVIEQYINGTLPAAPWIDWGMYLWANGDTARSDGLSAPQADYKADNYHPNSTVGVPKHAAIIHTWMMTSQFTPWARLAA